ncbi:unnamed protein product [Polarella glacialis]|uniref:Uncharacterized protein n=1 Tax=Polarella glacialis TaxID=89957 RepID=A0A813JPR5_POLGL|nr:unnamed protein product [Polarella glacialis]
MQARFARSRLQPARCTGGIKILEDSKKAGENLYWAHEDAELIKKMIANHPELSPEFQGVSSIISSSAKMEDKVKLVFMKHGIPPINKALIADITALVEEKAQA